MQWSILLKIRVKNQSRLPADNSKQFLKAKKSSANQFLPFLSVAEEGKKAPLSEFRQRDCNKQNI